MNLEQFNESQLLTFHCDGRVTVSIKLKPDETAKLVLDRIKTQWMDDIQCEKIRELNERIKRLEEAGDAMERWCSDLEATLEWIKAKEAKP